MGDDSNGEVSKVIGRTPAEEALEKALANLEVKRDTPDDRPQDLERRTTTIPERHSSKHIKDDDSSPSRSRRSPKKRLGKNGTSATGKVHESEVDDGRGSRNRSDARLGWWMECKWLKHRNTIEEIHPLLVKIVEEKGPTWITTENVVLLLESKNPQESLASLKTPGLYGESKLKLKLKMTSGG